MLEILEEIISVLQADSTLTAVVPVSNILTGPVDMVSRINTPTGLVLPAIIITTVSEAQRARPTYVRDTMVQIDIWTINSQLELETITEQVILDMEYISYTQGTANIPWQMIHDSRDIIETDRRIWHKAISVVVWAYKSVPNGAY